MAEPTVDEMLINVRTAMNGALLTGGAIEWEFNGRRVRRDYHQLLEIEAKLLQRQASESSGGALRSWAAFESRPS